MRSVLRSAIIVAVAFCSGDADAGTPDNCSRALLAARSGTTSIEACAFVHTDTGAVIAYRDRDTLYFMRAYNEGTEHFQLKLQTGTVVVKRSTQRFADRPITAGGWPDAKQLYFPFDVANAIRDRAGQRGTGFVCLNPTAAQVTAPLLAAGACPLR
jgi:hypothetical protein